MNFLYLCHWLTKSQLRLFLRLNVSNCSTVKWLYAVVLFFQVLKWVEQTVRAMKVHLLSSDHELGQEARWELPFDPSLKEVTVSLSGPTPHIELRDPRGT